MAKINIGEGTWAEIRADINAMNTELYSSIGDSPTYTIGEGNWSTIRTNINTMYQELVLAMTPTTTTTTTTPTTTTAPTTTGGPYGPELITNGNFNTNISGWTSRVNWNWESDGADGGRYRATPGSDTPATWDNESLVIGKTYHVVFSVGTVTAGGVWAKCGNMGSPGIARYTAGTFSEDLVCAGSTVFYIYPRDYSDYLFNGYIDNISVKEVLSNAYSAEYQAVYNAMTNKPSTSVASAQNTMVESMVTAGIWTKLDVFYMFAQYSNTTGEALINWKNPGTFNATNVHSTAWTSLEGFTGDGVSDYLSTGFNPTVVNGHYQMDNACIGGYTRLDLRSSAYDVILGVNDGSFGAYIAPGYYFAFYAGLNDDNGHSINIHTYDARGLFVGSRITNDTLRQYWNGTNLMEANTYTYGFPNSEFYILRYGSNYSSQQVSCAFIGSDLNNTEQGILNSAIETYMDYNGKGVIPNLTTLNTGIIGFWPADEVSGTTLNDTVGSSDFTLSGTAGWSGGLTNDGSGGNVIAPHYDAIQPTGDKVSVSLWVYFDTLPSTLGHNSEFFTQSNGTEPWTPTMLGMSQYYTAPSFSITTTNGEVNAQSTGSLSTSTWYHLVGVYDGANMRIYRNNVDVTDVTTGTVAQTGNVVHATYRTEIAGRGDTANSRLDGTMKDIGIWDRALTTVEVAELYNAGSGKSYPFGGGLYGPELVTNGGFDSASNWYMQGTTAISGGKCNLGLTQAYTGAASQLISLENGKTYRVSYTVSNYSSGNLVAYFGNAASGGAGINGTTVSSNGDYIENITTTNSDQIYIVFMCWDTVGFTLSIDNVSVKEIL